MVRLQSRHTFLVPIALLLAAGPARAEDSAPTVPTDSLPGSQVPPGLGLSPEAPPVPPAAGGRAPSFGAPSSSAPASFRFGGRFFGWETVGIGSKPGNPPVGYSGTPLHMPALSAGKIPFWGGAGATFNLQYGTPSVTAFASYYARMNRAEYQSYANAGQGPGFGVAYLLFTPAPIATLRLQFRVGAFVENYAGPGQWGWGIFGPLLALRGFGETSSGEWDLTPDLRMNAALGLLVVPGVPEDFVRGDYNSWIETGVSSWVNHAHLGFEYRNQYVFKLHYASDHGTDERHGSTNFNGGLNTNINTPPGDGRMDTYLAEVRWLGDPWGQVGVSGGLYDFHTAASVGDGVWWAIDWTQGAGTMITKYLGTNSNGTGKVAVVGAEYNFSVSRILWSPRTFTGLAPDIRVGIAGMLVRTIATADPIYKDANAYFFGIETEYRMSSTFSVTLQTYGESRASNLGLGRFSVYSLNPGIAYHSNWFSTDRIQLIYSRRYYSSAADPNSAQPLDRDMIALGGYVTF
jgi:hypothetical protein